jgi:hypothetical protein
MSDETVALKVLVSYGAVTAGQTLHTPIPLSDYYLALIDMGLLSAPETDGEESGQVLAVDERGDETSLLGVMPARRRGRPRKVALPEPMEADSGQADS